MESETQATGSPEKIPGWLRDVLETACAAHDLGAPARLGWKAFEEEDTWEAWVYPERVELVGGRNDGEEVTSGHVTVDLSEILASFDEPPHLAWCRSGDIPEISIEGKVEGHDLWLHLLEEAPVDEAATMRFDVNTGTFEDKEMSD